MKQDAAIKFYLKIGKSATETFELIKQTLGMLPYLVYVCLNLMLDLKKGKESLEND